MGGGQSTCPVCPVCPTCPECGKDHCASKLTDVLPVQQSTSTPNCLLFTPTNFYGDSVSSFSECSDKCSNDKNCMISAFSDTTPMKLSLFRNFRGFNTLNITDATWQKISNGTIDGTLIKDLETPCALNAYNYTSGEFT